MTRGRKPKPTASRGQGQSRQARLQPGQMGLTPASRSRVVALAPVPPRIEVITGVPEIERVVVSRDAKGNLVETPWVRPC